MTGLSEGPHTFQAAARDLAGNVDATPAQRSFTVDVTAPDTVISSGPTTGTTSGSATFAFSSPDATASFECKLDSGTFAACTSPKSYSSLSSGSHHFEVRAKDPAGNIDASPAGYDWSITGTGSSRIRLVAANVTSGNLQSYDPGEGTRILKGLKPDIVMIQEFNYGDNSAATIRGWVDSTFGTGFSYFREGGAQIPNGVISRYPILQSGEWTDTQVSNRDFAWAEIDIPGPVNLWVVSVHLLTSGSTVRNTEATNLVNLLKANVPAGDWIAIAGDFNTDTRTEPCLTTFSSYGISEASPYAADQNGTDGTNAGRSKPYDHVLVSSGLRDATRPRRSSARRPTRTGWCSTRASTRR